MERHHPDLRRGVRAFQIRLEVGPEERLIVADGDDVRPVRIYEVRLNRGALPGLPLRAA